MRAIRKLLLKARDKHADTPKSSRCYETARSRRAARSLRKRRRSRSDVPPQIPNCSLLFSAYSRHCERTSHCEQTARAALDEPPRSGKKISGSTSAHRALDCHSTGCSSLVVMRCMSPAFLSLPPGREPSRLASLELQSCNSSHVIHGAARPLTCVFTGKLAVRCALRGVGQGQDLAH